MSVQEQVRKAGGWDWHRRSGSRPEGKVTGYYPAPPCHGLQQASATRGPPHGAHPPT
jgi:hypothetical protein